MGWYQWQLFVVVGFGWASDNFWPVITSLIFTVSVIAHTIDDPHNCFVLNELPVKKKERRTSPEDHPH